MKRDEGVIKFDCRFHKINGPTKKQVESLIDYRTRLYDRNLIGVYQDGIGFGNISVRHQDDPNQFIISASQTGHLKTVTNEHFSTVTKFSIKDNWIECQGHLAASSESLTHAMIYAIFTLANAVIHVHNHEIWPLLIGKIPTTSAAVAYGTKEMAWEIERLNKEDNLASKRVLVMAGHEGGILSFGLDLNSAYETMIRALESGRQN